MHYGKTGSQERPEIPVCPSSQKDSIGGCAFHELPHD
jgi:hypothetical protein